MHAIPPLLPFHFSSREGLHVYKYAGGGTDTQLATVVLSRRHETGEK